MKPLLTLAVLLVAIPAVANDPAAPSGQTTPSPYYLRDDVQFFPPGPEFEVAAVEKPAATDEQRFSLNLNAGFNPKFGLHVSCAFSDRVRGIDVPNVTIPLTMLVRPRANGLVAFAKWSLDREEDE